MSRSNCARTDCDPPIRAQSKALRSTSSNYVGPVWRRVIATKPLNAGKRDISEILRLLTSHAVSAAMITRWWLWWNARRVKQVFWPRRLEVERWNASREEQVLGSRRLEVVAVGRTSGGTGPWPRRLEVLVVVIH